MSRKLRSNCSEIENIPDNEVLIIDFMAYARRIPLGKLKLETFNDLATHLCNTFTALASHSKRVDIVFDLYYSESVKEHVRLKRSNDAPPINVDISHGQQKLPVDTKLLWSSSSNKLKFEQVFIKWMLQNFKDPRPFYFGGAYKSCIQRCVKLTNGNYHEVNCLKCPQEEADDRIMIHIDNSLRSSTGFKNIVIASADTDVMVSVLYHYHSTWKFIQGSKIWCYNKLGCVTPIHDLYLNLAKPELVSVLPAMHALNGCDTVSKLGSKVAPISLTGSFYLIAQFGKAPMTIEMISNAERFLVHCILKSSVTAIATFDDLRSEIYHKSAFKLDLRKLPCTSGSIVNHIKRAYYQCSLWINAIHQASFATFLDPNDYGYLLKDDVFVPVSSYDSNIPSDLHLPCKCLKCVRETICPCRVAKVNCCMFCKCLGNCRNPY